MLTQTFAPALNGRKLAVGDVLVNPRTRCSCTVEAFDANKSVYLRDRGTGESDWYTAFCLPVYFYLLDATLARVDAQQQGGAA